MAGKNGAELQLMLHRNTAFKNEKCPSAESLTSSKSEEISNDHTDARKDHWGSRIEFLFAIVGYTVGIGSVWRFPMKCAANGGGAFLIPFFIFMTIAGGPLYYIEVCIGQYSGMAAGKAFEFCPLFKGLGYLMVVLSFNFIWYYVIIMAWVQYYLVNSFSSTLSWTTCDNWWNTEKCRVADFIVDISSNDTYQIPVNTTGSVSPAMEFWAHNVLRMSDGLETMGQLQWHLVLSNFVAWTLVALTLIKGVKSLGKVVYVTATAPYILLTVLLIRGLMLDGSREGILWYITPDFNKLKEAQVWLDAAVQVIYSLGLTNGSVITMSSHNRFHQKSFTEVMICVFSDLFTAFYAGLAVFAILGFMAKEAGVGVEELAQSTGPGLAFVAFPEAISRMPLPQLWAVLFFLTLIMMVFDTTFGSCEAIIDTLSDLVPKAYQTVFVRRSILIGVIVLLFVLGLPLTMNGGIYVFKLADWYIAAFSLLLGASIECIIVCWIYGTDRLAYNIEMMTGRRSSVLLRFFWGVTMTASCLFCFLFSLIKYTAPNYGDGYTYKPYAITLGFIFSLIPTIPLLICMIQQLYRAEGNLIQRVLFLLRPSPQWLPADKEAHELCLAQPYEYKTKLTTRIRRNILGDKNTPWI